MTEPTYIAIVDDHAMFRKGLASLINFFPAYNVLFDAANGKDFISQLKPPHLPHIALVDINMPEMDGYATADWIRVNHPAIKVIALSTMDSEAAIIKMIRHGACGYVLKDAEPTELKNAFAEVMSKGFFYNDMVTRKILQSVHQLTDTRNPLASFVKLNDREMEFLKYCCTEKTYKQIAAEMFLSERTIDGYREALFQKLAVTSRVGLAMYAVKNGVVAI